MENKQMEMAHMSLDVALNADRSSMAMQKLKSNIEKDLGERKEGKKKDLQLQYSSDLDEVIDRMMDLSNSAITFSHDSLDKVGSDMGKNSQNMIDSAQRRLEVLADRIDIMESKRSLAEILPDPPCIEDNVELSRRYQEKFGESITCFKAYDMYGCDPGALPDDQKEIADWLNKFCHAACDLCVRDKPAPRSKHEYWLAPLISLLFVGFIILVVTCLDYCHEDFDYRSDLENPDQVSEAPLAKPKNPKEEAKFRAMNENFLENVDIIEEMTAQVNELLEEELQ